MAIIYKQEILEFLKLHQKKVYHIALAVTRNPAEAEELAQDVFVRALQYATTYRGEAQMLTWLRQILFRVCVNHRRRANRLGWLRSWWDSIRDAEEENWVDTFPDPGGMNPESIALLSERQDLLKRLLEALPPQHRQIIMLRDLSCLEFSEIKEMLGLANENAVRVRLSRARSHLAREALIALLQEAVEENAQTGVLEGYRRIISRWDVPIALTDNQGKYITQNTSHCTLLGYNDVEIQALTARQLLGDERSEEIEKKLRRGKGYSGKLCLRNKSGVEQNLDTAVFVVPDRWGKPLCQLWIHHAITDRTTKGST